MDRIPYFLPKKPSFSGFRHFPQTKLLLPPGRCSTPQEAETLLSQKKKRFLKIGDSPKHQLSGSCSLDEGTLRIVAHLASETALAAPPVMFGHTRYGQNIQKSIVQCVDPLIFSRKQRQQAGAHKSSNVPCGSRPFSFKAECFDLRAYSPVTSHAFFVEIPGPFMDLQRSYVTTCGLVDLSEQGNQGIKAAVLAQVDDGLILLKPCCKPFRALQGLSG